MTEDSKNFVTYKEFYQAILEINKQRSQETDSLRSLIIATADNAEKGDLLRHTSIRGSIKELSTDMDSQIKEFRADFKVHENKDDEVADRVLIIEQTQKRIIWLVTLIFPSAIAVWEAIKTKLGLGK